MIPQGLAYDMLFGSNSRDAHKVLDEIYKGFERPFCKDCKYYKWFNDYTFTCGHKTNYISGGVPKDFGCNLFITNDSTTTKENK